MRSLQSFGTEFLGDLRGNFMGHNTGSKHIGGKGIPCDQLKKTAYILTQVYIR